MKPETRNLYNSTFAESRYSQFIQDMQRDAGIEIPFRVAETPCFFDSRFKNKLLQAGNAIIDMLLENPLMEAGISAVPPHQRVPNADTRPLFICLDFALVAGDNTAEPDLQLIELQGFASLYMFQYWLANKYREHFNIPKGMSHVFAMEESEYIPLIRNSLLNGHDPAAVVMMDLAPLRQKTAVDFILTRRYTGIEPVCISEIISEGDKLYYLRNGSKTRIRRIYNRVIPDELMQRRELINSWEPVQGGDVEWAGHPDWFYRISKYMLPWLRSPHVPETHFLSEFDAWPENLESWVLKPLYSFSGKGVNFHPTNSDLEAIPPEQRSHYILQRKVEYLPGISTPEGGVKAELRLMYLWPDAWEKPRPLINLMRLSRGEMIGVSHQQEGGWIGGSVGFFDS
jgi:hypothetical protein